jgi:hypothetical protein
MPKFIEFSNPTFAGACPNWVYEIKTDGYRAQVHVRNGRVTIYPAAAKTGPGNLQQLPKQRRA